ncbi:CAAX amino terminal protease self- immunity [Clostridium tepidiprofundi DSM 19306]|uniref:CAAX amino terminal protease self-immunity n=1 Tax=Clostridium tepidiprofundi DSM 19306 TaxID=1121338 RepID=A0A151B4I6_9CLOT|nr:type II CAAX endopeptidase family protein [Clostridium tepidiprofundi]KYH34834.1 CAAX amino terminal protease self- immunity [Clostridium tepidiprofundi DSM 19306]
MDKEIFTTKKAILAIFLGILILVLAQGISNLVYALPLPTGIKAILFGVSYVSISYNLIKLSCNKLLHISLKECHINKSKIKIRWILCAILLPVIVSSVLLCTSGELVKNNMNTAHLVNIVIRAIFTTGLGAGVTEEMVFRGLIMEALEKRWGKVIAIIIPSIIFGLLHAIGMHMNIIDILLLFVAGTSVGIMFSLIVYESGSIWCSAIVHGIWNVIMIGNILDINVSYNQHAIFSYKLLSKSFILTGGKFGIESSIVAVLGYITVIVFTLFSMKRKSKNGSFQS